MERRLLVAPTFPHRDMAMLSPRYRLAAPCPNTSKLVATRVVETEARLSRLSGRFVFWCPHCRSSHAIDVEDGCVLDEVQTFGRAPTGAAAIDDPGRM